LSYETLTYAVADGVATITINRPDAANAMSPAVARELHQAALDVDSDSSVRAVILTGAGRMFCAGGDLAVFATAGDETRRLLMEMAGDLHMALSRFARNAAPLIAAVNGTAAGAGFSLVMACDLAIAADNAVFTMAYTNAGLSPDGSSTYYMPRKIGDRRTRELMLTNRLLKADEALEWGIVNRVVPGAELMDTANELAHQIAAGPSLAFGQVKSLLDASFDHSLETQMELEARAIAAMAVTEDGQEGINAFLDKRKPAFKGQ
jgi:2-(1,2-epoxy-1,2-dihydrophenyl)acetyl-CoA isomerase